MACALQGAPRDGMLKEMASYDTIGNAFFALTIHAIPLCWRCVPATHSASFMIACHGACDTLHVKFLVNFSMHVAPHAS